jgi:CheY-like chemotaxis protein
MYVSWLQYQGFTVFDAADAESGFLQAVERQPGVVITDYLLRNGPNGAELCRRLKNDPRTAHIPTLLMTGAAERRTVDRAVDFGCAIVRLKPYLPDAMIGDIEAIVRGDALDPIPREHA